MADKETVEWVAVSIPKETRTRLDEAKPKGIMLGYFVADLIGEALDARESKKEPSKSKR